MVAGLRAERDRLLREVLYLRSGQMVGGRGDDLDVAARIAAQREDELRTLRADLAATASLLRNLHSSQATDIEIKLEASRQRNEELEQQLYKLSARVAAADARTAELAAEALHCGATIAELTAQIGELTAQVVGANARIAELEASTSWQITAPVRVVTARLGALR
jgi:chromosome segregation ATPase